MGNVIFETQKAVYTKLSADAALSAVVKGIYEYVPGNQDYPYITIDALTSRDNSTKDSLGYELDLSINVYSNMPGRKESLDIIEQISSILDDQALTVDGFATCMLVLIMADANRSADGRTMAGKLSYKLFLRK